MAHLVEMEGQESSESQASHSAVILPKGGDLGIDMLMRLGLGVGLILSLTLLPKFLWGWDWEWD